MTNLSKLLDEALAVTRAATPAPWSGVLSYRDPDNYGDGLITSVKANGDQWGWQDEPAIVLWRALAEPLLNVAKELEAWTRWWNGPGREGYRDPVIPPLTSTANALAALHQAAEAALK